MAQHGALFHVGEGFVYQLGSGHFDSNVSDFAVHFKAEILCHVWFSMYIISSLPLVFNCLKIFPLFSNAVSYLQTNHGGITIFGWTVDRALLNTIFFIELSLITFVLGKTLVFTST